MPPSRAKYKGTTQLYTDGREVMLDDGEGGVVVYLRAMNPLERQDVLSDAQAARGRIVLALKEIDSDETVRIHSAYYEDGRAASIASLLNSKTGEMISTLASQTRDEKEWKEKLEVLDRSDELKARNPEDIERKLLEKIESDFLDEVNARYDNDREVARVQYESMGDDNLIEELTELWSSRRGDDAAQNEYQISELWHTARCCDGTRRPDGEWDHELCEGHRLRLYETKAEVAVLPDRLLTKLLGELAELNMSVRDAKNVVRLRSSSDSSPQPSAPVESTLSTPPETPSDAPGIYTRLSSTP